VCEDVAVAALVLILTGTYALAWGLVRGYLSARSALLPMVTDGEPTRRLIEASKPVYARTRVRSSVRSAVFAVVWLTVAMYGLFLATVGVEVWR
jgi:hypothetical protein